MDTLCGQAWGAREYRTCGVVLQRGVLIGVVMSIPIILFWAHIEPLLLLLGQSPAIVAQSVPYLICISPLLLVTALAECFTKWLTSQVRLLSVYAPNMKRAAMCCIQFVTVATAECGHCMRPEGTAAPE